MKKMRPKLQRPEIQRCYVTATDATTRQSKTTTIYDATPETVIKTLESAITDSHPAPAGKSDVRSGDSASPGPS